MELYALLSLLLLFLFIMLNTFATFGLREKRLQNEMIKIIKNPINFFEICRDRVESFTLFFKINGPEKTIFFGGEYIGKIVLPPRWPERQPQLFMLTPNGKFNTDIDLLRNLANWSPIMSLHSLLISLTSYLTDEKPTDIFYYQVDTYNQDYKKLAENSKKYNQRHYSNICEQLDLMNMLR